MAGEGMRAGRLAGAALLLVLLLYMLAGECFQAWVRLYLDTWQKQRYQPIEQPYAEWARVQGSLDRALSFWPWKQSLYRDAVRVQFFGESFGHLMAQEAGAAALDYLDRSGAMVSSGEMLMLRTQAHLRRGDAVAMAATIEELRRHAPHERAYWYPLLLETAEQAMIQPDLEPVSRGMIAYYATFDLALLRPLVRYSPAMRAMLPVELRETVLPQRKWWGPAAKMRGRPRPAARPD